MTAAEYQEMINGAKKKKKGNKFGAIRKEVDGHNFHSTGEAARYGELKMLHRAKMISEPILQFKFLLPGGVIYACDFLYLDYVAKKFVVEDYKGHLTQGYIDKKKAMLEVYGIEIYETGAANGARSAKNLKKQKK